MITYEGNNQIETSIKLKSTILTLGFSGDNKLLIVFMDFPPFHNRKRYEATYKKRISKIQIENED